MAACSNAAGLVPDRPGTGPGQVGDSPHGRQVGGFPRVFLVVIGLLPLTGCAEYRFGNRSLFPVDVQTVYVPVFESSSFRRDLGERLTEAVCKEIERRSPYKVAGPSADSVLSGRIVGENRRLLHRTRDGDPRELEVNLQIQVKWLDRRGNVLRQCPPVPVPPECIALTGTSDLVPETGQSQATAQQKSIQRLAGQIVNLMEAPW